MPGVNDERAPRIAVCGGVEVDGQTAAVAREVGERLATAGAVLVCGGLGGVMEAAARGARSKGGLTVGILPGTNAADANDGIVLPLPTGMGEMRNALVVRFAQAVIAIGGEWGTLSEIALAKRTGVPVILLVPTLARGLDVETVADAATAVARALERARAT